MYTIDGSQVQGVDVNNAINNVNFSNEQEIAVPGGIPSSAIKGAQQILPGGQLGDPVLNPNYRGAP